MAGLNGGNRATGTGNGRISGGKAGSEHRMHFPSVDTARWNEANYGGVDRDERWGGQVGPVLTYPNTMGQPRGKIMGAGGPTQGAAGFVGLGGGKGRSGNVGRARSAQSINDRQSKGDSPGYTAGAGTTNALSRSAQGVNDRESIR